MMLVESDGRVVLPVDEKRERRRRGREGPIGRVREQGPAQLPAVESMVDRQAADPHRRQDWVAGKTLRELDRQLMEGMLAAASV